jgi:hypothetical protein
VPNFLRYTGLTGLQMIRAAQLYRSEIGFHRNELNAGEMSPQVTLKEGGEQCPDLRRQHERTRLQAIPED